MFYFVYLNPGVGGGERHVIKYNVCAINYIDFAVCQLQPRNTMYDTAERLATKMFSLCEDARRRRSLTCPLPVNGRTGHGDKSI